MVKRAEHYVDANNLPERSQQWQEEVYRQVRPRSNLVVKPERCVLLVIDMQRYFVHPEGRAYQPAAEAMVPGLARMLAAWRHGGHTVVFTRHCHRGQAELGMLGRFFDDYIRCGEADSQLIGELAPQSHERILRKITYDAFHGTGLEAWLRERGIEQVLLTGVLTQLCCETTARSAFVRGFEVYVAADWTATSSEVLHLGSLRGLATGVASIVRLAQLEERCRAG